MNLDTLKTLKLKQVIDSFYISNLCNSLEKVLYAKLLELLPKLITRAAGAVPPEHKFVIGNP